MLTLAIGCASDEVSYEDGTYTAEGELDDHGWMPRVEIIVENGEITSVDYDEVNEAGDLKSEDEDYSAAMEGVSGVRPSDAYEQLENQLLDNQDVDQVELVTGATSSSESFKALVNEALAN